MLGRDPRRALLVWLNFQRTICAASALSQLVTAAMPSTLEARWKPLNIHKTPSSPTLSMLQTHPFGLQREGSLKLASILTGSMASVMSDRRQAGHLGRRAPRAFQLAVEVVRTE